LRVIVHAGLPRLLSLGLPIGVILGHRILASGILRVNLAGNGRLAGVLHGLHGSDAGGSDDCGRRGQGVLVAAEMEKGDEGQEEGDGRENELENETIVWRDGDFRL